ncbi:hypothetical protein SM139_2264 [Stenotrophomonas maltophilia]|nr:hypothetical protein SM139_2264 [Stenotrophomonas maltophilia]
MPPPKLIKQQRVGGFKPAHLRLKIRDPPICNFHREVSWPLIPNLSQLLLPTPVVFLDCRIIEQRMAAHGIDAKRLGNSIAVSIPGQLAFPLIQYPQDLG